MLDLFHVDLPFRLLFWYAYAMQPVTEGWNILQALHYGQARWTDKGQQAYDANPMIGRQPFNDGLAAGYVERVGQEGMATGAALPYDTS